MIACSQECLKTWWVVAALPMQKRKVVDKAKRFAATATAIAAWLRSLQSSPEFDCEMARVRTRVV